MNKKSILKWGLITGAVFTFLLSFIFTISRWFDSHMMIWQSPVKVTLNKPLQIVDRELLKPTIIQVINEVPTLKDLTPIEEYICEVFGPYDCRLALAVFTAESGLRENAFNANTNGSIDLGPAQINSVHWDKEGCGLKDLVDEYKNIDCAKQIYDASGWHAWSAFNNSTFKGEL